jgi:hypothetical protein
MNDSKFDIEFVRDKYPSLGKGHQVKLPNKIKQLRAQLYKTTALPMKSKNMVVLTTKSSCLINQIL